MLATIAAFLALALCDDRRAPSKTSRVCGEDGVALRSSLGNLGLSLLLDSSKLYDPPAD